MTEGMELVIGKDGVCRARKEPWGVFECETEQDFHFLECAVEFYKKHQWIPVTEMVPEIGVPVLVLYHNAIDGTPQGDAVAVQLFGENCWYWWEGSAEDCDCEVRVEITHWMPLPEIPCDTPTSELVNEESTNCAVGESGGSETDES